MGRSVSYPTDAEVAFSTYDGNEDDWDDLTDNAAFSAIFLWPSMKLDSGWAGGEDKILASNTFAYFGVSEYQGVIAYWLVARTQDDARAQALADGWVSRAGAKLRSTFGTMRMIGVMSDGRPVFQKT